MNGFYGSFMRKEKQMKVYEYDSYEEYVKVQTEINKEKLTWCYVKKRVIQKIVTKMPELPKTVLCHGTRSGMEQRWFQEYLPEAEVLGTEISDTATQFDLTIQWDMQNQKDEWIGKWDVVYTNAFDHCMYPQKTLQTWKDQLSKGGSLVIEYAEASAVHTAADPVDATLTEVEEMMTNVGFKVSKIPADCRHKGVLIRGTI